MFRVDKYFLKWHKKIVSYSNDMDGPGMNRNGKVVDEWTHTRSFNLALMLTLYVRIQY